MVSDKHGDESINDTLIRICYFMYPWILVALGGSLGALARYALASMIVNHSNPFPISTFIANITGSFFMGVCFILVVEKTVIVNEWRYFLMVGLLGAFTTFSTFSIEALSLLKYHSWQVAGVYVFGSIFGSMFAAFCGVMLAEKLF